MTFYEDFFERVINISWEEEPEVYWVAGCGTPIIVNGFVLGLAKASIFTSEDGHTWSEQKIGNHEGAPGVGISALYTGGWMREGLKPGTDDEEAGAPVWVLVGADGRTRGGWAVIYSYDGMSFFFNNNNEIAEEGPEAPHSSGEDWGKERNYIPPSEDKPEGQMGQVRFKKINNFKASSSKKMISENGAVWEEAGSSGGAQPPIVYRATVGLSGFMAAEAEQQAAIEPFDATPAPVSAVQKKARKKVFQNGTSQTATGKVRKGPYAGKTLTISLFDFDQSAPAHGKGELKITAKDPNTGQEVTLNGFYEDPQTKEIHSAATCGLKATVTIAYGHYVFCIGGTMYGGSAESGTPDTSSIAYTDDGINWQVQNLANRDQINVIAVGPRPEQRYAGPKPPQS